MHVLTKYDGGKVINLSQSGLWEHSCINGAGLQHNMGKEQWPVAWSRQHTFSNIDFKDSYQQPAKNASSKKERKRKDSIKQQRWMKKVNQEGIL